MNLTKKKTTRCQGNHPMLSRSYASKEEFLRDYKKFYGKLSESKEFYLVILTELEKAISESKIGTLTKLNNLIDYMNNIINHEVLRNYYDDNCNPIRNTNLIILASKHNKVKILEYLFDNDNAVLNNLTGGIGRTSILPVDKDEANHNAIYYAIRSENIQLLGALIDKWPGNYFVDHLEELEEVLSKSYEDLKLKNVLLSDEMEVFVERKLIDLRFFSTALQDSSPNTVDFNKTKERIELARQCIRMLNENYSNAKKVDDKFLYIAKFIARNVHILKGRLGSTYTRIPWEEMEFCLIIFVSSQTAIEEVNLFYRAILNKKKILKYLVDFAKALGDRENINEGYKLHHVPKGQTREEIVKNIIGTYPQFEELYNDYHQIRDKYSLKRISDHIQLAVSVDAEEKQGQFVIIRVLQVIGEHLKNSLESPKLSHTTGERLVLLLSQNARKIITDLRNEISHSDLLLKIMETDGKADVNFFNNIQNDVRKVGDVITDIFYENRIKTIRILLKKVAESETPDEMKDVLAELRTVEVDKINIDNFKPIKFENLVKLIEELNDNMNDKTNYENRLFNKIYSIINSSKNITENVRFDYLKEYAYLRSLGFELNFRNHIDENYFKNAKITAKLKLNNITAKIKVKEFEEIIEVSKHIFHNYKLRIPKNKIFETSTILTKIISFVEFEKGDIKWIEEFREKLPKQEKKRKGTKQNDETKRTFNKMQFEQKVNELKSILTKNSLEDIKNNEQVQSVVKLFVLNLMSILGGQEDYLQNNIIFLDDNTPLLHGKCLRNYLAHDNALVDLLLSDPLNAIILNAEKFTKTNIMESTTKIGKLVSDDPTQLKKKLHQDLDTITKQEKMFVAVEEGDLDGLKDYLQKGADIRARSTINSWTTLHFAAQGPSLEVIRYILDQNLSVNVKDNIGQTPLHIAATHGRQNIVNFFLKQPDVRVDVLNNLNKTPLHVAAEYGHKAIVEILLNNKANIYAQDRTSSPPLYYAIRNNFIDVAKILVKKDLNFDINEILANGMTVLHIAAFDGHLELVNFLLKNGSEINARDNLNRLPLHYAARNNHLEVVIALILKGANVNARDIDGKMPLHHAIYNGNIDLINCLLTNGAYVNTANITPLHIASLFGRLEIVTTLLKCGADIQAECDFNCTPLYYAALHGHTEVANFLIQNGAQINPSQHNFTALHVAAMNGHRDVVHLLMKKNAQVNARTIAEGFTAMHFAARNGDEKLINLLMEYKAEINVRCTESRTPLHLAVQEDHQPAVNVLINKEADVNASDNNGFTPLNLAAEAGNKDIVEILISKGARVNDKHSSQTPLFWAIKSNQKEMVEVLLEKGAIVNLEDIETWSLPLMAGYTDIVEILLKNKVYNNNFKDFNHCTPLHMAALRGHKKIVKALIRNGADVNAKDNNHATPLWYAAEYGLQEVAKLLIASGAEVNYKNKLDLSPLHGAALNGHSKIVNLLLDNKANFDVNQNRNNTPVRLALAGGHLQVVKTLLQYIKVNLDAKDEKGLTLLHIASQGTNLELVNFLIDKGSDINVRNSSGCKAIHVAAKNGFKECIDLFVSKGLSFNELSTNNATLLHFAAMESHVEVINYLIEHGADVNGKDTDGCTPMHVAAGCGHKAVIEVLLQNGAIYNSVAQFDKKPLELTDNKDVVKLLVSTDKLFRAVKNNSSSEVQNCITAGAFVNAKNTEGFTPLYYAAWKGYDEVVGILLQNKANPNVVNNKGCTPLHYAAKFSHLKVIKSLLSYHAVYNPESNDDKTPSDLTEDKSIISFFKSVSDCFKHIERNNCQVIDDLNKISDIDTVKAIMCARNRENKTLVLAAMHSRFSEIQQLKEIGQDDISAQISKAIKLFNLDQLQESLCIFKDALRKRRLILGSDNPGTLDIQIFIADILRKQGIYQEALNIFQEILEKQKEMFSVDSEDALKTRSSIALVMNSQGKDEEALNNYRKVYQKQKETLGPNNYHTLATESNMALVLLDQEKLEDALSIFRSVCRKIKPENSQKALVARSNIANVLSKQGNNDEALNIFEEIYEKQKILLGINHSDTLGTLHNIGIVLFMQKKFSKSLTVLKNVLNRQESVLKPNHPNILMTRINIGNLFFDQKNWIKALKVYNEELDVMKTTFGSNHPKVLTILKNIECINLNFKLEGRNPSEMLRYLQININNAASKGDIRTIQSLLEDGADANDKDQDGRAPLYYAISNGHVDVVNILLKYGADVTQVTNKGNTPLHTASSKGSHEIADILLRHVSPDKLHNFVNAKTIADGATSLHVAAKNGFLDIAISLLKRGAIYNITNNQGKTPLDLCKCPNISNILKLVEELFQDAENGKREMIKKLSVLKPDERVAVTNARNNQDHTLLQVLIANEHKNIARTLVEMLNDPSQNVRV